MEDALDAPQRLLTPRGDAVEGFVIVLQCATALTEGRGEVRDTPPPPLLCHGISTSLIYCNPSIRKAETGGWQV